MAGAPGEEVTWACEGGWSTAWHGLKGKLDKGPGALLSLAYFNPNHSALTTHAWLPLGISFLSFTYLNMLQSSDYLAGFKCFDI